MVLDTVSRYAAAASAKEGMVTLRGVFRQTPRGLHKLGPAHIWYQDALGLTQISVSSQAPRGSSVCPIFVLSIFKKHRVLA